MQRRGGWAAFERSTAHRLPCALSFSYSWRDRLPRPLGSRACACPGAHATGDAWRSDARGHGSRPLHENVGSGPEGDCTVRLRTVPRPDNLGAFRAPARSRCAVAATPRAQQEGRGAALFHSPCRARSTRDLGIQGDSRQRPTTPSGSASRRPLPPARVAGRCPERGSVQYVRQMNLRPPVVPGCATLRSRQAPRWLRHSARRVWPRCPGR